MAGKKQMQKGKNIRPHSYPKTAGNTKKTADRRNLMDQIGSGAAPAFTGIIATLVIGLIIGFIADRIMGAGGLGLLWSIVLGLVGSVVGGFIFSIFGAGGSYGPIGQIVAGIVGACVVLFVARKLRSA